MKLLIGGSPCTYWSIAKTVGRETEASGMGWELFRNYVIARDKFQPDYFLYENNKSMSSAIREQITAMLGVEPVCINSALVSAQNRQRLYWVGKRNPDGTYSKVDVPQPEDRGILLRDVLDNLYARPVNESRNGKSHVIKAQYANNTIANFITNGGFQASGVAEPVGDVAPDRPVYRVENGLITVKGKQYPTKLRNGRYIIRRLSVAECKRLQTVPSEYKFPVADRQAYKMLGNGWTVDVIAHIMKHFELGVVPTVDVLSMYDGMACGHIALDKLGVKIRSYVATEIDKYAVQTATHNFPDIKETGDAFQVRDDGWSFEGVV